MKKSGLALAMTTLAAAALLGCASDDDSTSQQANSTSSAAQVRISSSIAEGAQLTDPVRWRAHLTGIPTSDVEEVRFLIDGKVRHVERLLPYQFAGDHNLLLPGTLATGSHTFAVDARMTDGRRLTTASTATVSKRAEPVPAEVVGVWSRSVAPAEVRRTADFRRPEYGDPLPLGTWTVEIAPDGVARYANLRLSRRPNDVTVGQVRFEPGGRLVVGDEIPNFPNVEEGYFCPDTVDVGTYRWSVAHGTLVVHVVNDRECADRNSFWSGRFTRAPSD